MSGRAREEITATETDVVVRGGLETERIGREFAAGLSPGDVVLINGEVGAGKSTMIRAVMRELGVEGAIPSPTFTIGRYYDGESQKFPIAHLDLYRVGELGDEDSGLLSDYFGSDLVTFVEWPGQAGEEMALGATRIHRVWIEHLDQASRRIRVSAPQA